MVIIGEAAYEVLGKSLYYLCNFSVNLKLFEILKKWLFKNNTSQSKSLCNSEVVSDIFGRLVAKRCLIPYPHLYLCILERVLQLFSSSLLNSALTLQLALCSRM